MKITRKQFAEAVKATRVQNRESVIELANDAEMAETAWRYVEAGGCPSVARAAVMLDALGVRLTIGDRTGPELCVSEDAPSKRNRKR